jgi:glycosyltransferase involved in cell wall biosynthesis
MRGKFGDLHLANPAIGCTVLASACARPHGSCLDRPMSACPDATRVTLVSGCWPPSICGVGDFMHRVGEELEHGGAPVERLTLGRFNLGASLRATLESFQRNRIVYMSYPTEGYGWSLLPFLLSLGSRHHTVLHIHEYGSKRRFARFMLRRFQRMERLFFSNAEDQQRYLRDCGLRPDSTAVRSWRVVPTPSNIPVSASRASATDGRVCVLHFGQIRPKKGLESLLEVLGRLDAQQVHRVVVGGVPSGYEEYGRDICERFQSAGIDVRLNLTPESISEEMSRAHVAVFPFPDGADERRGSLIAAMSHGLLCVTTHSARTPPLLREATLGVAHDGDLVPLLSTAVQQAISSLHHSHNQRRIQLAKDIGANTSFNGVVQLLVRG